MTPQRVRMTLAIMPLASRSSSSGGTASPPGRTVMRFSSS
eukprot:CAMPEP_0175615392 /NCGR_PEP_ID=MMETSP0096-20121207/65347_1 /TAXON_ID=311494 /ORGANISM="Alexandrium monilatum, Strain CCMP3105" /LENGTH=39 /DNA_ID= /DNA_START= /DNA_END= /DNA_ORIENTATION=